MFLMYKLGKYYVNICKMVAVSKQTNGTLDIKLMEVTIPFHA